MGDLEDLAIANSVTQLLCEFSEKHLKIIENYCRMM